MLLINVGVVKRPYQVNSSVERAFRAFLLKRTKWRTPLETILKFQRLYDTVATTSNYCGPCKRFFGV